MSPLKVRVSDPRVTESSEALSPLIVSVDVKPATLSCTRLILAFNRVKVTKSFAAATPVDREEIVTF